MAQQLPCNNQGICMTCQARPDEHEKLICVTCITPWHVTCLSINLPSTLADTNNWVCPDCSGTTSSDPIPPPQPRNDGDGELVAAMLAVENDTSLTQEEKARKRQQLLTGKAVVEEEKNDINNNNDDNTKSMSVSETLNCSICFQLLERPVTSPCGHTFCLKCFQKWIGQGKKTCATCRRNIPAKMASHPRINSALAFAIRTAKASQKNNNNNGGAGPSSSVNKFVHNQDKPDKAYTTENAKKKGVANACSGKIFVTVPGDHFGPILPEHDPVQNKGVVVGDTWPNRITCRQWGAHFAHVGGINGQSEHGAQSVALSGGYVDDEDHGEWFLYTGSGGKDLSGNKRTNKKHSSDQRFENYNRALQVSCLKGYPVRVVRSDKEKRSSYAPQKGEGVRYDGIYRVEKCWQVAGKQGFLVCRYLFVRCDNVPAPWTSDDHGDRPRPLPVIGELQNATVVFERTESPFWDFDEQDSRWKWMQPPPPSRKTDEPKERTTRSTNKKTRKNQSMKEQLKRGFSCLICKKIMVSPVTTPCGHSFCKSCLEGVFDGQSLVKERSRNGRMLRSQKKVMKCPACSTDIAEYLEHLQVDVELKNSIESLKAKDDTATTNETSVKELNGSLEGSDVSESKLTKKALIPAAKRNAKRKEADSTGKLTETSDGRSKRGRKKKNEKVVEEGGHDSPPSPLNLP